MAVIVASVGLVTHEEETWNKWNKWKETSNDATSPGLRSKETLQNSWQEVGRELSVSWSGAKEMCRSVLRTLSCPLVDVLLNIHANMKEARKNVGSDDNIA